jgi:alpha-ketoglutarate-dependent taurine dioxygenase
MSYQPSKKAAAGAWAARRKAIQPKAINLAAQELVKTGCLGAGPALPLVVEPALPDVDLCAWAGAHLPLIEAGLRQHGALLFRGFGLRAQADFEAFLEAVRLPLMHYIEGATPRTELNAKVYTSTEYPAEHSIALHNELNYVVTWPMRIFFYCVTPAARGGATPIADVRRVFARLDARVRERFIEKGWMLVRNFGDGLSLPWQQTFRVSTRAELEAYCRGAHVEVEWKGGDRLRTRQVRAAVRRHPQTGELVWFNHVAFWHVSSLTPGVREMFLSEFAPEELPYNTYYGDGSPIPDEVVEQLRRAYDEETVAFPWQAGDLLMMDNMLVAHGRQPFQGARKILAAMGEPFTGELKPDLRAQN